MDIVYRYNYKYFILAWMIFTFCFAFCIICIIASTLVGGVLFGFPLSFAYILFFMIPNKIIITEKGIIYKTLLINRNIKFSEIKELKSSFSTKSMTWHAGDKKKADMLCQIKLEGKPFTILVFGDWITDYKSLFDNIIKRSNSK